jgi:hypothetical protein
VEPVCGIDVCVSRQPRGADPGELGGLPTSAGTAPPDTCGDLSFEGFDELRVAVAAMMTRVRRVMAGGSSLADLEEAVHQDLLTLGAAAVQDGLNAVSAAEVRRRDVTGPEGASRPWVDPGRARTVVTLFGDVTFTRLAYRGPGLPDVFPADQGLDLPAGPSYSRALEARTAYLEALLPHRQVRDLLAWETGVTIHTRQQREIAARAAADTATFARTRTVPEPDETPEANQVDTMATTGSDAPAPAGRVLVATFDGKGVIMRREALRTAEPPGPGRARLGSGLPGQQQPGHRPGRKRLAELSCIYDVQTAPRTADDVIQELTRNPATTKTTNPGPPRPRARARWLQASLTATIDQVVTDAFAQADRRDPAHQMPWLVLVDGTSPRSTPPTPRPPPAASTSRS